MSNTGGTLIDGTPTLGTFERVPKVEVLNLDGTQVEVSKPEVPKLQLLELEETIGFSLGT